VKEKKLCFASGASSSGLHGIAIGRSKCSIRSYLIGSTDSDGLSINSSIRLRKAHVGRTLINITNAALKQHYVLFGLRLDDLMCYDEDNSIKLFFTQKIYKLGSHLPEVYYDTMSSLSADHLLEGVAVESTKHVLAPHAMWILGVLLFELFIGLSLQDILSSDNPELYASMLSNLTLSNMEDLIDLHCGGPKNWLRRELLKEVFQRYHQDLKSYHAVDRRSFLFNHHEVQSLSLDYIDPDRYLEKMANHCLFFFIEKSVPEEVLEELLDEHPYYASTINMDGLLPIHYAIKQNSYPRLLVKLIELYPTSVSVNFPPSKPGEVGDNLIIRALNLSLSDEHIRVLIPYYMPIDLEENALPVVDHQFAFTRLVHHMSPPDLYVDTVKATLQKYYAHAKTLSLCADELGRSALHIATPLCKAEILKVLYFMGRYDFKSGVAHQSATCTVKLAVDTLLNRDVALKFMKYKDQFEREVSVRKKCGFDEDYVIGYLEAMDGDVDPVLREELNVKGLGAYKYCLIMVEADRSMHAVIAHEHIAGKDWDQIRVLCAQLTKAVYHVHSRGMIHGDIKRKPISHTSILITIINFFCFL